MLLPYHLAKEVIFMSDNNTGQNNFYRFYYYSSFKHAPSARDYEIISKHLHLFPFGKAASCVGFGETRCVTLENDSKLFIPPVPITFVCGGESSSVAYGSFASSFIPSFADSYSEYYAKLGEPWTPRQATEMMCNLWYNACDPVNFDLCGSDFLQYKMRADDAADKSRGKYFLVAIGYNEKGELIPLGFFGCRLKCFYGGGHLFDGEIFVKPEYQKLGIGSSLLGAMVCWALMNGINIIEGITYDDGKGFPINTWLGRGFKRLDYIPIEGETRELLRSFEVAQNKTDKNPGNQLVIK